MAKINEQTLTIKLSQLLRDNDPVQEIINDDNLVLLIEALKTMAGDAVMIELE
jgi:hypothetical protein